MNDSAAFNFRVTGNSWFLISKRTHDKSYKVTTHYDLFRIFFCGKQRNI